MPSDAGSDSSGYPNLRELERAIELHSTGDLDGAEKSYKRLLKVNSGSIPALHLLGRLHAQKGQTVEAAGYLERAVALAPDDATILADLARIRSIEGDISGAVSLFRKAIDSAPNEPDLHFRLAQLLVQLKSVDGAIESYNHAIRLKPEFAEAHNDLGALYIESGKYEIAKRHLERAVHLDADLESARLNLAHLFAFVNEPDKAETHYLDVVRRNPSNDQALENLSSLYELVGEYEKALQCLRDLAAMKPGDAAVWRRLGDMAQKLSRIPEAAESYERSLELDANQPETLTNLSASYGLSGKLEQAASCLESAVGLRGDLDRAYHNLGSVYHSQGRLGDALVAYEHALQLTPSSRVTLSNLISVSHFQIHDKESPMPNLFHRYLCSVAPERIKATVSQGWDRTPERRLRVGYVSPDFRQHSVSFFISPAISGHDRLNFEIYCYSDVAFPDRKTQFLRSIADHWRDIHGKDDDSVADLIRRDRIDILVDLDGHYAGNRLPVFAERPSPVQISYLGYPSTTGLPEIGYRLTDAITDPIGEVDNDYTEMLIRFPNVFICYEPPDDPPLITIDQRTQNSVCFGSFNELAKISSPVVRAWAKILHQVPESTLLLKARAFTDEGTRNRVSRWFTEAGVDRSRVELLARTATLEEHLALYARVDVALDTFPYNGTTTTCEALYMGVPVIAFRGDSHVSRVGASLLTVTGLNSLIAESEHEYVRLAVALARDQISRQQLHESIRDRVCASPLTDKCRFVAELESIYRQIWSDWCQQEIQNSEKVNTEKKPPNANIVGAFSLKIVDSNVVWLPDETDRLTVCSLFALEDWYEDELGFMRDYLKEGMRVLDVGAHFGLFTLAAAKIVGNRGYVWSFEPASISCRWLSANVRYNRYENVQVINAALSDFNGLVKLRVFPDSENNHLVTEAPQQSPGELVNVKRLDRCVVDNKIADIDFVKLDAGGAEKQIVNGGRQFFVEESPLVMFEIRGEHGPDWSLVELFRGIGYAVFRLVPGLEILVPAGDLAKPDDYTLNLFACSQERENDLMRSGILVSNNSTPSSFLPADVNAVWQFFEHQEYSREFVERWKSSIQVLDRKPKENLLHLMGCYVAARAPGVSAVDAFALLKDAHDTCAKPETNQHDPAFILTKARLAGDLGERSEARDLLAQLLESDDLSSDASRLPFLPATRHFDSIAPGGRFPAWLQACVLDAHLRAQAFSYQVLNAEQLAKMERLRETGFERPEMERRRLLLSARLGRTTAAASAGVLTESADNLNPEFWREFQPDRFRAENSH